jgi:hypothetical protein
MKLIPKIIASMMFAGSAYATDAGPYYLASANFCNVRELYISSLGGYIYGQEVGCTSSKGQQFGGYFTGGTSFAISSPSTTSGVADGGVMVIVFDLATSTTKRSFTPLTRAGGMSQEQTGSFSLSILAPRSSQQPRQAGSGTDLPDENLSR